MKAQATQPKTAGKTEPQASKQASVGTILQAYKNGAAQAGVVQRVKALATGNPYEFEVEKSDLGTGTATSEGTREYVNASTTTKPSKIKWEYGDYSGASGAYVKKGEGETDNPVSTTGRRWDAGHALGRQNGGLGNDNAWVFPQTPEINRGNSLDGKKTFIDWRQPENAFHTLVDEKGKGKWKVTTS